MNLKLDPCSRRGLLIFTSVVFIFLCYIEKSESTQYPIGSMNETRESSLEDVVHLDSYRGSKRSTPDDLDRAAKIFIEFLKTEMGFDPKNEFNLCDTLNVCHYPIMMIKTSEFYSSIE